MVVVVIITLLDAISGPGINKRLRSYKARQTAEEIATIYRTARLRAVGRGSAVLVRFDSGANSFEVREAIQGAIASEPACASLPETSCTTPSTRWNSNARSQQIRLTQINGAEYEVTSSFFAPSDTSSAITGRASLDICYTPLGVAYADMETTGLLERMITTPRFDVSRTDGPGLLRSVLINSVGPARVVADDE
jgi:type IV fimbrial biogenesis protein FimT